MNAVMSGCLDLIENECIVYGSYKCLWRIALPE